MRRERTHARVLRCFCAKTHVYDLCSAGSDRLRIGIFGCLVKAMADAEPQPTVAVNSQGTNSFDWSPGGDVDGESQMMPEWRPIPLHVSAAADPQSVTEVKNYKLMSLQQLIYHPAFLRNRS